MSQGHEPQPPGHPEQTGEKEVSLIIPAGMSSSEARERVEEAAHNEAKEGNDSLQTMITPPAAPAGVVPKMGMGPSRKGAKDQIIERFEQKFVIHPRLVPPLREWMQPFVVPDPNGKGDIPEYVTTTLQLDTPHLDLALAKERKCFSRFKLRIRTYGTHPKEHEPVFIEIKRKVGAVIIKSRSRMKRSQWRPTCILNPATGPFLKSPKDNNNYLEFCRIANAIGARPKMNIRYIRESYFGSNDDYARITFDRRVSYRPERNWHLADESVAEWKYWRAIDTQVGLRTNYAGYIFELKAMRDTPTWMLELVRKFNLRNQGFCKYAVAVRLESLFRGATYADGSENTTLVENWI